MIEARSIPPTTLAVSISSKMPVKRNKIKQTLTGVKTSLRQLTYSAKEGSKAFKISYLCLKKGMKVGHK